MTTKAAAWQKRIDGAQEVKYFQYRLARIRYGSETSDFRDRDRLAAENTCGDCDVRKGQFHVIGCDQEQCPACKGQFISCDCSQHASYFVGRRGAR
jgi:hypothetical protein